MHDMGSMLPPFGWQALLDTWHFRPWWTLTGVVLLAGYLVAWWRSRRAGTAAVHGARVCCFVAGVALLVATVSSAVDVYAMAAFWVHMVEHLLLIMVIPTLLALGHPLTILRAAASGHPGRQLVVDRWLTSGPVALLTHPLVGFGIYSAVIIGTHLTGFMDAMAMRPSLMGVEQVLYLVAGYLFLLPMVSDEPIRWRLPHLGRLLLVLVAMTPDTVVGIVLMQSDHNLFPMMTAMRPAWAPAPLTDIGLAGGLMWAGGDGLMMLIGLGVVAAMILTPGGGNMLGTRLENIRRQTMAGNIARSASGPDSSPVPASFASTDGVDVDDDEAVLAAYNQMLGNLGRRG